MKEVVTNILAVVATITLVIVGIGYAFWYGDNCYDVPLSDRTGLCALHGGYR